MPTKRYKVLVVEEDGTELLAQTELDFNAAKMFFDITGTQFTKETVAGALVEAKRTIIASSDPTQSPGLPAPLGWLAIKDTDPVDIWLKIGPADTDWQIVGFGAGGGSGVTPPFFFSRGGTSGPGTYLSIGEVVTSNAGQLFPGKNTLNKMTITARQSVSSTTRIQLQRRTGETTFSDITNAYVDLPSGQFKASRSNIGVDLNEDEEVAAYVKSGDNLKDVILGTFPTPRS